MNHLVLSVGGARGSFQAGALSVLLGHYSFDHIYGGSVGALNGAFLSVGGDPIVIWNGILDRDVYKRNFSAANCGFPLLANRPMLNLDPLVKLMNDELLGKEVLTSITVEVVERNGILSRYTKTKGEKMDAGFLDKIYSSASIPFVFPTTFGFDSGLQNPIPLSAAIDNAEEGDFIAIVSCHPVKEYEREEPKSEIQKLAFTLDTMQSALVRASVNPFLKINELKDSGDWKQFRSLVISPDKPLPWGMLDFTYSSTLHGRFAALKAIK